MTKITLPVATSVTHEHLLACVNSLLMNRASRADTTPARILDAGCGNGKLIAHLYVCLTLLQPWRRFELYGFDVTDHGVQAVGFVNRTVANLTEAVPDVNWSSAIRTICAADDWPFEKDFFDIVVSNQVLEHVHDHGLFFRQSHRVLRAGGASVHLFPLKHYVHEGHLHLPWVHRIRSHDLMRGYIALLSRIGLGKYPQLKRDTGVSVEDFAERHADYMFFWTRYVSEGEAVDIARRAGFRVSYRYTFEFYAQKILNIFRRTPRTSYRSESRGMFDAVSVKFLRYVSSVTLTCIKDCRY